MQFHHRQSFLHNFQQWLTTNHHLCQYHNDMDNYHIKAHQLSHLKGGLFSNMCVNNSLESDSLIPLLCFIPRLTYNTIMHNGWSIRPAIFMANVRFLKKQLIFCVLPFISLGFWNNFWYRSNYLTFIKLFNRILEQISTRNGPAMNFVSSFAPNRPK